ncbi:MAG TPA: chemotaxis protein CheW [Verrucomicrobiae bacterium]
MLLLCFEVEGDAYGLPARAIKQVLPLVRLKRLPGAPAAVAGLLNYRTQVIPVLDVRQMLAGQPSVFRLSTRVLIVECAAAVGSNGLLGLIVERATHTLSVEDSKFDPAPVHVADSPYLGPVAQVDGRLLQRVEPDALLTPEIVAALTQAATVESA